MIRERFQYKTVYRLSDKALSLACEITDRASRLEALSAITPQKARQNRIELLRASLAFAGWELSTPELLAILEGHSVPDSELHVRLWDNTLAAHNLLSHIDPNSQEDLIRLHGTLMKDLTETGQYRNQFSTKSREKANRIMAPVTAVPRLMEDLFAWNAATQVHPLIRSIVAFFEFEMIHPFAGGNSRTGRMWLYLQLGSWKKVLLSIPGSAYLYERREEYASILSESGRSGDCSKFIEFMLEILRDTLAAVEGQMPQSEFLPDAVDRLLRVMGEGEYSNRQLMELIGLHHRQTFSSNYLKPAMDAGMIEMTVPETPNSRNQRYRKTQKARKSLASGKEFEV